MLEDADEGHRGLGAEKTQRSVALLVDGACLIWIIHCTFIGILATHHHEHDICDFTDVQDGVDIMTINDPEDEALLLRGVAGPGIWADVGLELRIPDQFLILHDLGVSLFRHRLHLLLRHRCIPQLLHVLLAVLYKLVPQCRRIRSLAEPKNAHNLWRDIVNLRLQRLNALLIQILLMMFRQKVEATPLHEEVFPLLLPQLRIPVESLLSAARQRAGSRGDAGHALDPAGRLLVLAVRLVLLLAMRNVPEIHDIDWFKARFLSFLFKK